jgi:hypothetical protein
MQRCGDKIRGRESNSAPLDEPKFDSGLKSLQAQLKAATTQHHLHSVDTYVYDPSIKN